jgi:hypothetical protein
MTCPWCMDEAEFVVDEADEELVCGSCAIRTAFAPDPAVTYGLQYSAAA